MDWVTGRLTGNLRSNGENDTVTFCWFSLRLILGMKMQFCLEDSFNGGVCASQNNVCVEKISSSHSPLSSRQNPKCHVCYVPIYLEHVCETSRAYKWHRSSVSQCHGSQGLPFSARSTTGRGNRNGSATASTPQFLEKKSWPMPCCLCSCVQICDPWSLVRSKS